MGALPDGTGFTEFTSLELNERGLFVDGGRDVPPLGTQAYLKSKLWIAPGVTDVFVWVHGWRNSTEAARESAARLFRGIQTMHAAHSTKYSSLNPFKPHYVAVHWPSESSPLPSGYRTIRDRAHAMTENGTAEFVLASLLGYLEEQKPKGVKPAPGLLRAAGGFYVHCVGHSFGGRFLAEAIAAAATPTLPVLRLLPPNAQFKYTVDTLLVFQMAAPPDIFANTLKALVSKAPLQGPVVLTHSDKDSANCVWHRVTEGTMGIGCEGAREPAGQINWIVLRPADESYTEKELAFPVVNVKADWLFNQASALAPQGAHSDFWYEESIHLLLSLVNYAR